MVFNVFFDPGVIDVAIKGEAFGIATLTSVLQGVLTNCLLCDFEDARGQTEIGQRLNSAASTFDLSVVKRLLAVLAKRNRVMFVVPVDYYSTASELDQALAAAEDIPLDVVLTEGIPTVPVPGCTVVASLAGYSSSNFETERSGRAAHGMVFSGGEHPAQSFLNATLGKALRHASRIEICDRLLGQKFGDNFEHTIKQLFTWLERNLADPNRCVLNIHCGKTDGRDRHFLHQLATFRTGRLAGLPITVNFYENPTGDACLPHQRYVQTDQFAFSIDRGMDFLDRASGNNRDASIDLKDEIEVARNLATYDRYRIKPATCI
jgi:hypothetical protein